MKFITDFFIYLLGAFGCMIGGLWISSQQIAVVLQHPVEFGEPLIILGHYVYPPYFILWWFTYGHLAPDEFQRAATAALLGIGAGILFILFFAFGRLMRKPELTSHGSARWATPKEIKKSGLLDGKGVVLGMTQNKKDYLCHNGPEHTLLVAPTGSGKGVTSVIPTCQSWEESMIILDVKKENWNKSAAYRKKYLKNVVIKFEPTSSDGSSAKFNPLDEIRIRSDKEVGDVQSLMQTLVFTKNPGEKDGDPHWKISAADFLIGVVLHLKYIQERASFPSVAAFLRQKSLEEIILEMMETEHVEEPAFFSDIYGNSCIEEKPLTHPVVFGAAQKMYNTPDKERGSIYSTAVKAFDLYKDPIISRNVEESDFCIADLMDYKKPVSLYLVTPPDQQERLQALFRVIFDLVFCKLTGVMSEKPEDQHKHKLLLLIDEFPTLQRMDKLQSALAWARGYNIRMFLIVQELNQIYQYYSKENSIIGNCKVRVFHAPDTPEDRKYISDSLGMKTIVVENKSYQGSFRGPLLRSVTTNTQETARALLTADEIGQLAQEEIIFKTGERPIKARKFKYFEDPVFMERTLPPPKQSDRIRSSPPSRMEKTHQTALHTASVAAVAAAIIPEEDFYGGYDEEEFEDEE